MTMNTRPRAAVAIGLLLGATAVAAQPKGSCMVSAPIHQGPETTRQIICGSIVNTCRTHATLKAAVVTIDPTGPGARVSLQNAGTGISIDPGGALSACWPTTQNSTGHVTRMVGIVAACASGPQKPPIIALSVREENSDPTTNSVKYRIPVGQVTVEDTTYGFTSKICEAAANASAP